MLYSSLTSVSVVSSDGSVAASRTGGPVFEPSSNVLRIHFFLIGFFWVIMSFFPFYLIVLYYYKMNIIGIDWFTVFYYIKYNLVILTGVPRISFDM